MQQRLTMPFILCVFVLVFSGGANGADKLPDPGKVKTVKLFTVPEYCEGVVFDHRGNGYISHGKTITKFTVDGKHETWAETGAPNGHKVLADGTHLVCDASHHAVLHVSAYGDMLEPASKECNGKPLRGPNDLTLDTPNGGFYFTDPGGSGKDKPIGTVHYVDKDGKTHLVDKGYAYSNGIVLRPNGKTLLVAESQHNRVWSYEVLSPGKVGPKKLFANLPKKDEDAGQIDNRSARIVGCVHLFAQGVIVAIGQHRIVERKFKSQHPAFILAIVACVLLGHADCACGQAGEFRFVQNRLFPGVCAIEQIFFERGFQLCEPQFNILIAGFLLTFKRYAAQLKISDYMCNHLLLCRVQRSKLVTFADFQHALVQHLVLAQIGVPFT